MTQPEVLAYPTQINDQSVFRAFRNVIDRVNGISDNASAANERLAQLEKMTLEEIQNALQIGGSNPLNVTGLPGQLSQDQPTGSVNLATGVSGVLGTSHGGTGVAYNRVADVPALTGQTADVGSTAFAGGATPGVYRVSWYLECTTADGAAGTVTAAIAFTDAVGATTVSSSALALTATGRTQGTAFIQLQSGTINYSTTHTGGYGSSQYALFLCLERMS
jgi:hypothetical protein